MNIGWLRKHVVLVNGVNRVVVYHRLTKGSAPSPCCFIVAFKGPDFPYSQNRRSRKSPYLFGAPLRVPAGNTTTIARRRGVLADELGRIWPISQPVDQLVAGRQIVVTEGRGDAPQQPVVHVMAGGVHNDLIRVVVVRDGGLAGNRSGEHGG